MKRCLTDSIETKLLANPLWSNKIKQDCLNEKVFLAIRKNLIDFYHNGGRLFKFDEDEFQTHHKYASVIESRKQPYLTQKELKHYKLISDFEKFYPRIKENCKNYSGREALGVSGIYNKYSYLSDSDIVVLDIEVSFKSLDQEKKQDRIDILLYNKKTQMLQFVEAKHFLNSEIWSTATPKVISQIERYENQMKDLNQKAAILSEYTEYINVINRIFGTSLPVPLEIDEKVTLLIFGFDANQKKGRLRELVLNNPAYSGVKNHSIGSVSSIKMENLWNARTL